VLRVHCQPGAGRDGIAGVHGDSLKVRVRAPAQDGAGNDALVRYLADRLGLAARDVELVSGRRSRSKRVRVRLDAQELDGQLVSFIESS